MYMHGLNHERGVLSQGSTLTKTLIRLIRLFTNYKLSTNDNRSHNNVDYAKLCPLNQLPGNPTTSLDVTSMGNVTIFVVIRNRMLCLGGRPLVFYEGGLGLIAERNLTTSCRVARSRVG